jgi:hypothetical protein
MPFKLSSHVNKPAEIAERPRPVFPRLIAFDPIDS